MSRLYDALRRAAQSDETVNAAADNLTQFAAEEPTADASSPVAADTFDVPSSAAETSFAASEVRSDEGVRPPSRRIERVPAAAAVVAQIQPATAAHGSHTDVPIRDVIRVLTRRWKLVVGVIVAAISIAALYNLRATPFYQARARLVVDPDIPQVVPFRQVTEDTSRFDYFATQLEVLRSRDLARKTLERLRLLSGDATQQSSQINFFLGSLGAAPAKNDAVIGGSRVINVTFTSTDPKLAAQMANGLAQTYVDENLNVRRQGSREASAWLNDRLAELRRQVSAREGALQQYREQKDAVSLDERQNIVVQKLAQLNAAVTAARTERVEKEALYKQLVAIQERGAPVDTFPAIIANNFIQGLKADLAGLQRERAQLAERLGDLHPDMIKVNTAIDAAERRLNAEMAKVIEGVKNDYKAAQARENGLLAALDDQKREVLNLNQKSIGYSALQRDATSTQQVFESVLQRVKETELSGQLQSNNARILDTAEVPQIPVWPRKQLNLAVAALGGLILGIGLVIGLEYLNPRITDVDHVKEAFGLPMLGVAPHVAALKNGMRREDMPLELHEALRSIRTRILLAPSAATSRSFAITSAAASEGKTTLATGLASSLAAAGRKVLLIDADLRRSP
jgi:uncharacterized protein involved in exopolysaccharide biosynthesis